MAEGEWQKTFTMLTIIIHFVHPMLCVANYLDWVRYQTEALGDRRINLYLAMTIIATIMYLLVASVFYMWAYRWPLPEEYSKKRRIYGVIVNLIFSDVPLFAIEVDILWEVNIQSGLQAACFVFTCLSFAYSGLRAWTYLMETVIKATKPRAPLGGVPQTTMPLPPYNAGQSYITGGQAAAGYNPGQDDLRHRHPSQPSDMRSGSPGISSAHIQARGGMPPQFHGQPGMGSPLQYSMPTADTPSRLAAGGIVPPAG
eukprot:TRINITY_DN17746_c0_g1_i1.p1 TRINITY_DN17746_c0_g1~~TRINITY_DN17746_c0_g1_i1.p1  ORF type:complete len:256 (+),score=59.69 TRINITY_DN17746_c0_g1_i1:59-826(+)